jgi:DNA modification methylase
MGRALIVQGDALRLPLPDESVDLIVTSPPFYQLRQYDQPGIGLEATPAEYLEALWAATREMVRVLKPTGSAFIELGDKYDSGTTSARINPGTVKDGQGQGWNQATPRATYGQPKSLLGLPWRYVLGCVDQLGLILRAEIIWSRVNGLPESVKDRVRASHSRIFHLTKQPRYYSALATLREPHTMYSGNSGWAKQLRAGQQFGEVHSDPDGHNTTSKTGVHMMGAHPLGKLPGSVWSIASDPLRLPAWLGVDHYAAWPPEIPRRLILGWSPPGICCECGQGRWPVVEQGGYDPEMVARRGGTASQAYSERTQQGKPGAGLSLNLSGPEKQRYRIPATILGWACACTPSTLHPGTGDWRENRQESVDHLNGYGQGAGNAVPRRPGDFNNQPKTGPWREYHLDGWTPPPTKPAVVLDPFSGVGTTCLVARALGRIGIGVDLSFAYSRAARYRVFESGEWQDIIARTTGRPVKPLPQHNPAQAKLL